MQVRPGLSEADQVRLTRRMILVVGAATMAGALFIGYTSAAISGSFMEAQVFWIAFQGILAMWFLIGVASTRATGGDVLRAFALAAVVTLATTAWYIHSRTTDRPVSFLFVAVPGEVTMLVAGLLPSLWRRRPPGASLDNLTLHTLEPKPAGSGRP